MAVLQNILTNKTTKLASENAIRRLTTFLCWSLYLFTKNDKKVYACFDDFQKAYDTIWRNGLFYKLMKYGFSQKINIFLMNSMYDRVVSAEKAKSRVTLG